MRPILRRIVPWLALAVAVTIGCRWSDWVAKPEPEIAKPEPKKVDETRDPEEPHPLAFAAPASRAEEIERAKAIRKKYPFESLADRLAYESGRKYPVAVPVSFESDVDSPAGFYPGGRVTYLKELHEMSAADFAASPGFGFERPKPYGMSAPPRTGSIAPLAKIEFDRPTANDEDPTSIIPASYLDEGFVPARESEAWRQILPLRSEIKKFHGETVYGFAAPDSFGYVESPRKVAGFRQHGFAERPVPPVNKRPDDEKLPPEFEHWQITRLELVSLLKHETPRVYVSDEFPRMDKLGDGRTRPLNGFESEGLKKISEGNLVHFNAATNRVEMMGALRAAKNCAQCHSVPENSLLGAFSYELHRHPPLEAEEARVAPAQ